MKAGAETARREEDTGLLSLWQAAGAEAGRYRAPARTAWHRLRAASACGAPGADSAQRGDDAALRPAFPEQSLSREGDRLPGNDARKPDCLAMRK